MYLEYGRNRVSTSTCSYKSSGRQRVQECSRKGSNTRESVSVLVCVNAAGQEIPPFCIMRGKTERSLHVYNTSEGVFGARYTYQEKAWMEDVLGVEWFKDHFLKHCGPHRPQLMLLDSHCSHETLGLIEAARENNITLLTFPPHTTHYLCPLDRTIFSPLSAEYNRVCSSFMSISPNNIVTKWEWPRLFRDAYQNVCSASNIKSGFKACGISPFNPSAVPPSAFKPCEPYDQHISTPFPTSSLSPIHTDEPTASTSSYQCT